MSSAQQDPEEQDPAAKSPAQKGSRAAAGVRGVAFTLDVVSAGLALTGQDPVIVAVTGILAHGLYAAANWLEARKDD